MGTASNLITGANATFMSASGLAVGSWTASSGLIVPSMGVRKKEGFDSLQVKSNGSNSAVFYLDNIDNGTTGGIFQFHAWVLPAATGVNRVAITVRIEASGVTPVERINYAVRSTTEWSLIRSGLITLPDDGSSRFIKVTISYTFDTASFLYFTLPTLIPHYHLVDNNFLFNITSFIPDFFVDYDNAVGVDGTLPDIPMTRYLDIVSAEANNIMNDYISIYRPDIEQGRDSADTATLSELVDPDAIRREFISWLSSITGNKYSASIFQSTPWGALPSTWIDLMQDIDPTANPDRFPSAMSRVTGTSVVTATLPAGHGFANGNFVSVSGMTSNSFNGNFQLTSSAATTITWLQAGITEIASGFGQIALVDTDWGEVVAYEPDDAGSLAYARWILESNAFGNLAGTRQGLDAAIVQNLKGTKSYNIIYSFGNVWTVKIRTLTADTPGGVTGSSIAGFLNAIELVRPCGFIFVHECVASI